jgi:HEAT repeat protein
MIKVLMFCLLVGMASRRRKWEEDDDEEPSGSGSAGFVVVIVLVSLLGLGLIGGGVYFLVNSSSKDEEETAETESTVKQPSRTVEEDADAPVTNLDEAVAAMRSTWLGRHKLGAEWVANHPVDPARQSEVASLLVNVVNESDWSLNQSAARALVNWATPENADAMVRRLNSLSNTVGDDRFDQIAVSLLQGLGRLKDRRAAPSVAKCLTHPTFRKAAEDALTAIGPDAADSVRSHLFTLDTPTRQAAMRVWRVLGKSEADAIDERLIAQLHSQNRDERQGTAGWLGDVRCDHKLRPQLAEGLVELLQENYKPIQLDAARALKVWAVEDNVPALIDSLTSQIDDSNHHDVCMELVVALGRFPDARAAKIVARCLSISTLMVPARNALATIGPPAAPEVAFYAFHFDDKVQEAARRLLTEYAASVEVYLTGAVQALGNKDDRIRNNALDYLIKTPPAGRSQDAVAKALNPSLDTDGNRTKVQIPALKAAEKWGTKENVPALLKYLTQPQPGQENERRLAMIALVAIKDERAVWPIGRRLASPVDAPHARAALLLMATMVEKVAMEKVEDTDAQTRADAWALLGLCGAKTNYDALKAIADKETNTTIKKQANIALKQIKGG